MRITYCECVFVALVIQHPKRMRHNVIRGLSGSTISFHILSKNGAIFVREKNLLNIKIGILIFSTALSEIVLILRKTERHVIKILYWPSCKVPVIFVPF